MPNIFFRLIVPGYAIINIYLIARLCMMLAGTGWVRAAACALLALLALCMPIGRITAQYAPQFITDALLIVGALYLAPMLYGFLLAVIADLLRLLNGSFSITRLPPPFTLGGRVRVVLFITALTAAICAAGAWNAASPRVVRHTLTYPDARCGTSGHQIKIALLSDLHLGRMLGVGTLRRAAELVSAEAPDIVLLAGDIMDDMSWDDDERAEAEAIFRAMTPRLGIWGITGNHEFYAGVDECADYLHSAGVGMLRDDWAAPGDELLVIGREDRTTDWLGRPRRSLDDIASEARRRTSRDLPMIVLDHQPMALGDAERAGAFLQLSGHTHNGQLAPVDLVVSSLFECHYGLYKKGDTNYYISCGTGTWGPPVRTSSRPEVVIITIGPAHDSDDQHQGVLD